MSKHIPYLFFSEIELEEKKLSFENFNHLVKVLRLRENGIFFGLDNKGNKFKCELTHITKNIAFYKLIEENFYPKNNFSLVLIQSITKIETFEEIISKGTQLGVTEFLPLITQNTTISIELFNKKISRFNKIIKLNSEQSQRIYMPELLNPLMFDDFKKEFNENNVIVAYEKSTNPMKNVLKELNHIDKLNLICGPEGGFTDKEINFFDEKKYPLVSLGKNILRSETAVTVTLGNILYELT